MVIRGTGRGRGSVDGLLDGGERLRPVAAADQEPAGSPRHTPCEGAPVAEAAR